MRAMTAGPLPREILTRDNRRILIREATPADAEELIARIDRVAGESRNLSLVPGEFPMGVEEERRHLRRMTVADNRIFLVAVDLDRERIVGDLAFTGGLYARIRHQGTLGMTVDRSYWGVGIGTALLEALIDWARAGGIIRKLNLRVIEYNQRAIALYRKLGFIEEGRHSRTFLIDGRFYDDISMGLEIDPG